MSGPLLSYHRKPEPEPGFGVSPHAGLLPPGKEGLGTEVGSVPNSDQTSEGFQPNCRMAIGRWKITKRKPQAEGREMALMGVAWQEFR